MNGDCAFGNQYDDGALWFTRDGGMSSYLGRMVITKNNQLL